MTAVTNTNTQLMQQLNAAKMDNSTLSCQVSTLQLEISRLQREYCVVVDPCPTEVSKTSTSTKISNTSKTTIHSSHPHKHAHLVQTLTHVPVTTAHLHKTIHPVGPVCANGVVHPHGVPVVSQVVAPVVRQVTTVRHGSNMLLHTPHAHTSHTYTTRPHIQSYYTSTHKPHVHQNPLQLTGG